MKYRADFVTNSSSTSFGGSLISALIALFTSFGLGTCRSTEDQEDGVSLNLTKMPADASKLVCGGSDPIWVYGQVVKTTEKGDMVDLEATGSIGFSVSSSWASLGSPWQMDEWQAIDVYGVESSSGGKAPDRVTVKASVSVGKKVYTKSVSFAYEAPPAVTITPDKVAFLSQTGEVAEAAVEISPAGDTPWETEFEADPWAGRICEASLEDVSDDGSKATLKITESDTEELSGLRLTDYYTRGRLTVRATSGEKQASDYVTVTVYREGLYVSTALREDQPALTIEAEAGPDEQMKATELDLCYLRWDSERKELVSDVAYLSENLEIGEAEGADETASNILSVNPLTVTFDRTRPSNLSSGVYKLSLSKVLPGKADERFKCSVNLALSAGEDFYSVDVPIVIKPAQMDKVASWQEQYEYCKKIINRFMPEAKRAEKLAQLEKNKHYMGAADLQMFRRECWDIAQDAMVKEAKDYLDTAAWYDKALYAAEWTVWITDRAFNAIAGTVFGPVGAYAAGFIKNSIADVIVKCEENWDKDWYTIGSEIVWSRLQDAVGSGIDSTKFSEPEVSAKFIASFVAYKFVWHLYFDKDDKGDRKGVIEAIKSAGWDLTGVGIEKALEPFVKAKAARDGLVQNEKLDELVKDVVAVIKTTLASVQ